jgi:hypothetical protein
MLVQKYGGKSTWYASKIPWNACAGITLAMKYHMEPYAETIYVAKIWPREVDTKGELCTDGSPDCEWGIKWLKSTHTLKDYKTLVKLIIELCEKGANESAKDNRDSVDTAASFANGRYVAYMEVLMWSLVIRKRTKNELAEFFLYNDVAAGR